MAEGRSVGGERWHRLNRELDRWRCRRSRDQKRFLIAGVAGLVAGAMSMAAGEYVSVSSQSDTEQADLAREREELIGNVEAEVDELAEIYVKRGVPSSFSAASCTAANGEGCPGSRRAGRAWDFGNHHRASRPSRPDIGGDVFCRRSNAVAHGCRLTRDCPCRRCFRCVSGLSRSCWERLGQRQAGQTFYAHTARVTFWGALAMALTAGIGKLFGTIV